MGREYHVCPTPRDALNFDVDIHSHNRHETKQVGVGPPLLASLFDRWPLHSAMVIGGNSFLWWVVLQ